MTRQQDPQDLLRVFDLGFRAVDFGLAAIMVAGVGEWNVLSGRLGLQASAYACISHGANHIRVLTLVGYRLGSPHQNQISD